MNLNGWNNNQNWNSGTMNSSMSSANNSSNFNLCNTQSGVITGYDQFGMPIYEQPKSVATFLKGRVVNDENDIMAAEIPNTKEKAYFVQSDEKVIYAKRFAGDGNVYTDYYVKVDPNQQPENNQPDPIQMIMERLDRIEKRLTRPPRKPKPNTAHKEVKNDESATN